MHGGRRRLARVRDRPRNPAYDFDKSWHFRGILLIAAAVSATAVGRAVLGLSGMLPAVSLYWFVTLADFFGVAAAISASGLVLSLATVLIWRGGELENRARRASHSVHRLLFEAHAI